MSSNNVNLLNSRSKYTKELTYEVNRVQLAPPPRHADACAFLTSLPRSATGTCCVSFTLDIGCRSWEWHHIQVEHILIKSRQQDNKQLLLLSALWLRYTTWYCPQIEVTQYCHHEWLITQRQHKSTLQCVVSTYVDTRSKHFGSWTRGWKPSKLFFCCAPFSGHVRNHVHFAVLSGGCSSLRLWPSLLKGSQRRYFATSSSTGNHQKWMQLVKTTNKS